MPLLMQESFHTRVARSFIGAALKGVVISPDNDLNEAVYGNKAKDILLSAPIPLAQMPAGVRIFPRTLARYSAK